MSSTNSSPVFITQVETPQRTSEDEHPVEESNDQSPPRASVPTVANDDDVLSLCTTLDDFSKMMLTKLLSMKENMAQTTAQALGSQRDIFMAQIKEKNDRIEELEAKLRESTLNNERLQGLFLESFTSLLSAHRRKRKMALIGRCFRAWRHHTVTQKLRTQRLEALQEQFQRIHLRRILTNWRRTTELSVRDQQREKLQQSFQDTESELNSQIQTLQEDLTRVIGEKDEAIIAYKRNRAALEDNLRKAFMRGVCALNMEALSVLNRHTAVDPDSLDLSVQSVPMQDQQDSGIIDVASPPRASSLSMSLNASGVYNPEADFQNVPVSNVAPAAAPAAAPAQPMPDVVVTKSPSKSKQEDMSGFHNRGLVVSQPALSLPTVLPGPDAPTARKNAPLPTVVPATTGSLLSVGTMSSGAPLVASAAPAGRTIKKTRPVSRPPRKTGRKAKPEASENLTLAQRLNSGTGRRRKPGHGASSSSSVPSVSVARK